ncbi:MAG: hypothetical protein JW697_06635 [Kosmotogaceae bacterium]|nr:hypothetical protein [Kosmotogaceae bacterium]
MKVFRKRNNGRNNALNRPCGYSDRTNKGARGRKAGGLRGCSVSMAAPSNIPGFADLAKAVAKSFGIESQTMWRSILLSKRLLTGY